jgi:hypothetical protein
VKPARRHQAERERKAAQEAAWRAAGLCVECGSPIAQGNRRVVRCTVHLADARARRMVSDARPSDRPYANTACPYCSVAFDPLPKAKAHCPSCGQTVWVRSGPDGLRYLLQEADLPVLEQAWEDYHSSESLR